MKELNEASVPLRIMEDTKLWIDTKLNSEEMDFLWEIVSEENKESWNHDLVGNISKSERIKDRDNWFYETALKKHSEKMFYRNCSNYYEEYIEGDKPPPKFEMYSFWVNYQKQYEFNPIHNHTGLYSFVIFMKIPTDWKEQHALPISANSAAPSASDFTFVWPEKDGGVCMTRKIKLCSEDEGRMLFFPATLQHQVYPFYECEEERVTISGNIRLDVPQSPSKSLLYLDQYEDKEKIIKMMENSVGIMKKELKQMKKESEKEE